MSTVLGEKGIETVHDRVVSEAAQRWARAFQCKVTIRTMSGHNPWTDHDQQSDIAGWSFSPRGNRMQWMAEVETEDSLQNPDTQYKWKRAAVAGVPIYLLIPRGNRAQAEKIAASAELRFSSIYEYGFVNGVVQIL
ncbi:MAG: hypothetical protein LZF86_100240 [Nitrospira sp.]|nr:MAG: hypothetical protein LZF86_100240 [Nitrospira sp.]